MDRHTPAPRTSLVECASCGLQYFVPAIPGDEGFYEELMRSVPYQPQRWEFAAVESRLRPEESVVDLGCGDGAFIRRLRGRAGRVVGVDHNGEATARMAAEGLETYTGDPASFAALAAGSFDVACGFQILEHMRDVALLVGPMRDLLGPHGRIFISVPDRDRALRDDAAPFDCPPHHISRWAPDQLQRLAEEHDLELVDVTREPIDRSVAAVMALAPIEDRIGELPKLLRRPALSFLRRTLFSRRRHERLKSAGEFARRGLYGHTMLAEFAAR